jgi:hypothetical protein
MSSLPFLYLSSYMRGLEVMFAQSTYISSSSLLNTATITIQVNSINIDDKKQKLYIVRCGIEDWQHEKSFKM